ncbi:PREDICTED: homeobox-leucine zipper protein HDG1-like [Camelina sativa]|uniref:Homeobox-leucine zipper protein HDG1-like n=1 Tax=Camelina sativa TaxID=90675 RepID=A0ABM0SLN2_CAMSA|nr:PREDICTED: homeobox-leucine zipper protein HDG1-like [Camelina sativa]
MLNREEYEKIFTPCLGPKPDGFVSEASKEVGMVIINNLALVETLMDSERCAEMFPCMIARNSTSETISSGMGGTRNGALYLMQAELQLLSPLVPVRQVTFLRFCKQHAEGVWAVVDVYVDRISDRGGSASAQTSLSCRSLPSGCLVQDMPNGYSISHKLHRKEKHVEASTKNDSKVLKRHERIMTRKNMDDSGEPPGILLSAATSVWIPVPPRRLFDFLRDVLLRSEWDILSNGGPMQEIANIFKGQDQSNSVSLLRSTSSMLILQETSIDAPVDIPAMHAVMKGADSAYVALLPSGFGILPDGQGMEETGSLLTVTFQILVNSLPTTKLNVESIETVNNLISCTVQKIIAALRCDK